MPSVIDEGMRTEHWWNNSERGKEQYLEISLAQCHFVQHKSYTKSNPGIRGDRPATV